MRYKSLLQIIFVVSCFLFTTIGFACSNDDQSQNANKCFEDPDLPLVEKSASTERNLSGVSIDLVTYDAFLPPGGAFESFTAETGIQVNLLQSADTGTMVSQSVLTSGDPVADVMFGIDNTFLCRGLINDIFHPYIPSTIEQLSSELLLDPYHRGYTS